MKKNRLFFASALALFMGTSLATAQTAEGAQPVKPEVLPTMNPETGARIIYIIPGQPHSTGTEFGPDVVVEFRVMPGFEDPATLSEEEKMKRSLEEKKAWYKSQGLNYEEGSTPAPASSEKEAVHEPAKAQPAEQKTVSPK